MPAQAPPAASAVPRGRVSAPSTPTGRRSSSFSTVGGDRFCMPTSTTSTASRTPSQTPIPSDGGAAGCRDPRLDVRGKPIGRSPSVASTASRKGLETMRLSSCLLSPRMKWNTHPRNTVRWKPRPGSRSLLNTKGFYKPMRGATTMKWQFSLPYVREVDSLYHYPAVSQVSGKTIDWYADEPQDGYEAVRIYGENTLELKGMPLGKTPEYVQERLRRFFGKFGPVGWLR
eukprot:symbB.v1.2.000581.t1/scaffold3.1/size669525/21